MDLLGNVIYHDWRIEILKIGPVAKNCIDAIFKCWSVRKFRGLDVLPQMTPPPRRDFSSKRKALWIKFGLACHVGTLVLNLFMMSLRLISFGIFQSTISVIMMMVPPFCGDQRLGRIGAAVMSALGHKQTFAPQKVIGQGCPLWANSGHALADCRQVIDDPESRTMAVWDEARTMPGLRVLLTHFCAAVTTSCY